MYVTEHRSTKPSDPLLFWELSQSVPRDPQGTPVETGPLPGEADYDRAVLGEVATFDGLVQFLKARGVGEIRVSDVEQAWQEAQAGGPVRSRRIRPRTISGVRRGTSTGSMSAHGGATRSAIGTAEDTGVSLWRWLVIAVIVIAVAWLALF